MNNNLIPTAAAPRYRQARELPLTYDQLADYVYEQGYGRYSKRWFQYRRGEGMPVCEDFAGRVRFLPSEVVPWLQDRQRRLAAKRKAR